MGLLSIFQRKPGGSTKRDAAGISPDAVQQARTRARRRLIGAVVLVVIGVIGFPLVFETQPRPIPVDIPIEIPRKDGAPPIAMPPARVVKPITTAPAEPASAPAPLVTEAQPDAGRDVAPPAAPPSAAVAAGRADTAAPKPPAATPRPAPAPVPAEDVALAESKRAQALLDGQPVQKEPPKKETGRFVVQVGAFADAAAARETRSRIEKLGLKTYTQVASTASGNRIRVRVGPFASREEADRALAKIKASGAQAVVLSL